MNPINITIPQSQRSAQQTPQPRSLLVPQPGPLNWLTPPSVPTALARLLVSVGGGLTAGAIGRVIPWGPEAIALAMLPALAGLITLSFLWQADRRGCWIAQAYLLFGFVGAAMAIGFGGSHE